jgi:hypothetical protein
VSLDDMCICGHSRVNHKGTHLQGDSGSCLLSACQCIGFVKAGGYPPMPKPLPPPPPPAPLPPYLQFPPNEGVEHPPHYGGKDNPYEHVKVVNALGLNYQIGCATKYLFRAGKKPGVPAEQDLLKARKFIDLELERLKPSAAEVADAVGNLIKERNTMETWTLDQHAKQAPLSDKSFLTYGQAMRKVVEGKHVRRPCWLKGAFLRLEKIHQKHTPFVVLATQSDQTWAEYTANVESILARDWYVYEPETELRAPDTPETTKS